jgi:hypothetical protein
MASKVLEQLELVNVEYDEKNSDKVVLTFLDADNGEIREVNFNKKIYKDEKWIYDEEKAEKVEAWCQEFFSLTFENLGQAVGDRKDVYCYDKFNSLFEVEQIAKFEEDMVGQIMSVEVAEVVDDGKAIKIRFQHEGETYESKMGYSTFMESRNEWFVNPVKRNKQYDKFKEKFAIAVEDKEQLVGKTVMIEVKKAMGKYVYVEIKPFPKKKK